MIVSFGVASSAILRLKKSRWRNELSALRGGVAGHGELAGPQGKIIAFPNRFVISLPRGRGIVLSLGQTVHKEEKAQKSGRGTSESSQQSYQALTYIV
jgi:hypothetical protein